MRLKSLAFNRRRRSSLLRRVARRDRGRESRTHASFAFDSHIAAEQSRQPLAKWQAQPCSPGMSLQWIFNLCELLEDASLIGGGDSNPGVGDVKRHDVATGGKRRADTHLAAFGELQSVRDEVA